MKEERKEVFERADRIAYNMNRRVLEVFGRLASDLALFSENINKHFINASMRAQLRTNKQILEMVVEHIKEIIEYSEKKEDEGKEGKA